MLGLPREARIGHELFATADDKLELEQRNGYRLADAVDLLATEMISGGGELSPELVLRFHEIAIGGIYSCSGRFRTWGVRIIGSHHKPPRHEDVEGFVRAMCDTANERTASEEWDAIEVAAYLLWRLNWIHPFGGGNGRTSRALCYLALCLHLGEVPEGKLSIAEQIDRGRPRYQDALEDADVAWKETAVVDVSKMTALHSEFLTAQIMSADPPPSAQDESSDGQD